MVRTGAPWRMITNDLPPWHTVYEQTQRWIGAGCFEALVHDLREMLRLAGWRNRTVAALCETAAQAEHALGALLSAVRHSGQMQPRKLHA